jgi:hypothetical protein
VGVNGTNLVRRVQAFIGELESLVDAASSAEPEYRDFRTNQARKILEAIDVPSFFRGLKMHK